MTEVSKSIKFPDSHYVGIITSRSSDDLPLAFMCPDGTDKAAEKRKDTVDAWVAGSATSYNYQTKQRVTHETVPPVVLKNEPMAGFRLLSSVRRYSSWGSGNVKWRVEDPRGFELEISSPNMMQIMACTVLDNGEILDACMWAREGAENVLVPVSSEVYKTAVKNTERLNKTASIRNLKIGNSVVLKNGTEGVYYGKMNGLYYDYYRGDNLRDPMAVTTKPVHVIIDYKGNRVYSLASLKLAEITSTDELSKEAAEKIVNDYIEEKTKALAYRVSDHYIYSFSNDLKSSRVKVETDWNEFRQYHNRSCIITDPKDGVLYMAINARQHNSTDDMELYLLDVDQYNAGYAYSSEYHNRFRGVWTAIARHSRTGSSAAYEAAGVIPYKMATKIEFAGREKIIEH